MRLTGRLCHGLRDLTARRWKQQWEREARFYEQPLKIPKALRDKGIVIRDAAEEDFNSHTQFSQFRPPVANDPRWAEPIQSDKKQDWHEESAYNFDQKTVLFEGVPQACLLSKTQHFDGLPGSMLGLNEAESLTTPHRDAILQRSIMLSQVWNTDETKMKKRLPDPENPTWRYMAENNYGIEPHKSAQILLRSMLRLCRSHCDTIPSLEARRHIWDPKITSHILYRGQRLVTSESLDCLITSPKALPTFASASAVEATAECELPSMWPVLPTVDLNQINNYSLNSTIGFNEKFSRSEPHTIISIPKPIDWSYRNYDQTDSQLQANQIMTCLLYTAAMARGKYGADVTELPSPICIQHISLLPDSFLVSCFQLNTLALDTDLGVKNMAWTSDRVKLFDKHWARSYKPFTEPSEREKLDGFNGDAFSNFLSAYLTGCSEIAPEPSN